MRHTFSLIVVFLSIICTFPQIGRSQENNSVLDIYIEAYQGRDKVKDVGFALDLNGKEIVSDTSKRGVFNFVIKPADGVYTLTMSKEGYLSKEIIFNSYDYPFDSDYEIQEIILECVPVGADMDEAIYAGSMKYDPVANAFRVSKQDTIQARLSEEVKNNTKKLKNIYDKAIYNGYGLQQIEEYEYAKGYYEIALLAEPNDAYAKKQLAVADSLAKIEAAKPKPVLVAATTQPVNKQPEDTAKDITSDTENQTKEEAVVAISPVKSTPTSSSIGSGEYFSVQLGAFVDWYDEKVFANVPDLLVVQGADYKRCISGSFETRELANKRKQEMRENGFKDAFVVTMKGNERIGF